MHDLKINDPVRIVEQDFETSQGLVKRGMIGRVLEILNEATPRVKVEIYSLRHPVSIYVREQFIEKHIPPDDEYR
jgi:hypothetical protein